MRTGVYIIYPSIMPSPPSSSRRRRHPQSKFESGNGMMTSIWGPSTWHLLHTISFNYPVNPTLHDKVNYRNFVLNLQKVLPCGRCRDNLVNNFKTLPLEMAHMASRERFSRYIYELHEVVNRMLGKTASNLSYRDVRNRYEKFRARCSSKGNTTTCRNTDHSHGQAQQGITESGCTEPRGANKRKSKCVLRIVPARSPMHHYLGCRGSRSRKKKG